MKALIIGGTKFIGRAIVEEALQKNHEVVLFNRGKTENEFNQLQLIKGDIEDIASFKKELLNFEFDIVVHCIAYTEKHAQDLRGIFKNTKAKLIILSSCDSYQAFQGLNRRKDLAELPIDERSPLSSMKYYWSDSQIKGTFTDTYDKNLLTDILMDGFKREEYQLTVFKLPLVYGPYDYQYPGRHGAFIQRILDKKEDFILSDREQCQIYTYGYIENLASAIVYSFGQGITNGKIYNLGEEKSRSRRRWAELYGEILGWSFNFHVLPEELIKKDKTARSAPPQHLLIDSALYSRETGFQNPIDLDTAIRRTFEYAKENPEVLGERPNYSEEEKLVQKFYEFLDKMH